MLSKRRYNRQYSRPSTSPLVYFAIDLIHELIHNTNPLAIKREGITRLQTEMGDSQSNFNVIGDSHSKSFPEDQQSIESDT
jgi:hypothetical protein